jgi:hypothetical protein
LSCSIKITAGHGDGNTFSTWRRCVHCVTLWSLRNAAHRQITRSPSRVSRRKSQPKNSCFEGRFFCVFAGCVIRFCTKNLPSSRCMSDEQHSSHDRHRRHHASCSPSSALVYLLDTKCVSRLCIPFPVNRQERTGRSKTKMK